MTSTLVNEEKSTLPRDDDHPYRTGAWQPNTKEYDAVDLEVIGEIPSDLNGVYIRNTENPLHDSIGRYHPFDGDGMLHSMSFDNGRSQYRNRFIRTEGLRPKIPKVSRCGLGCAKGRKCRCEMDAGLEPG